MAVRHLDTPALDAERIRAQFPIFDRPVHGKRLVYLDSASSAQKPRQVIDRLVEVYETGYANVHRGVYHLGAIATEHYEGARDKVAGFLNAPHRREVIFTRDTTEGLNLVAYAYGRGVVGPGDVIVSTEMEHHSNLVPWQFLAQQTGATLRYLRLTGEGALDPASLAEMETVENIKIVAVAHVSNSLGTINDVPALARWAHDRGAVLVVDGAQAAPHRRVDVAELDCDFYAISAHKMCGPGRGSALGSLGAPGTDESLPHRRRDDPQGRARSHILERPALEVRGRHARDRRVHRLRGRASTSCSRSAWRRSTLTSRSLWRTATTCWNRSRASCSTGRRRRLGRASSRSTWRTCIRTTSPRCSTPMASVCVPATIALSR